ncbi:MAG: transcriptional antiterminator, Rof [Hydrogenophilales bacterium]|nr:transcriptional antiterminator, Rof [Hydrogenophilales bacterium]
MQHERLEFAVLRRIPLHLKLQDGRELTGLALDVYTKDGAEWLKFRDGADVEETLRLDRIAAFSEL